MPSEHRVTPTSLLQCGATFYSHQACGSTEVKRETSGYWAQCCHYPPQQEEERLCQHAFAAATLGGRGICDVQRGDRDWPFWPPANSASQKRAQLLGGHTDIACQKTYCLLEADSTLSPLPTHGQWSCMKELSSVHQGSFYYYYYLTQTFASFFHLLKCRFPSFQADRCLQCSLGHGVNALQLLLLSVYAKSLWFPLIISLLIGEQLKGQTTTFEEENPKRASLSSWEELKLVL